MNLRLLLRGVLIFFLLVLTACTNYPTRRSTSTPSSARGGAANTGTATTVLPATTERAANPDLDESRVRDEIPPQAAPSVDGSIYVTPTPSAPVVPKSASAILLEEVDTAVAQGELERAAALVERALRIEPRDAFLWYRLASIRAQQGRASEAAGFARRALSFSTSDPALTQQINALLGTL